MLSSIPCLRFFVITGIVSLLSVTIPFSTASSAFAAQKNHASCPVFNGSFETDDFTGWETIGRAFIETDKYGARPTNGTKQAQLDTFSEQTVDIVNIANFLNITVDNFKNLGEVYEGSAIKTTVTVKAGDVLSFDWNFLTDDFQSSNYNDFAFFTISQIGIWKLADTFSIFPSSLTNATNFQNQTGFQPYTYTFSQSGTYSLGFGVVDVGDGAVDSGLLIDNVVLLNSLTQP